ncbi:hypothetical protein DERF_010309 [Dermatophagoides farinae]|uniref:Uncharacterized protein n=1 Tax=Dermatophagoides farinae TaxID=6954 RepID=A0A922L4W3_DERFA|nr:hypothetical protein DERF_010309 [Dermatophagoides farinae]
MISRWISWMANQTSNENESNDNDDDDDEVELNDIDNQIPTSGMIVIINIHTSEQKFNDVPITVQIDDGNNNNNNNAD